MSAVLLLIVGIAALCYFASQRRPKGFPPGPWGFPILGHLPLLGLEPYKTVARWIPKYGRIIGLQFGAYPCVIISDYKLIKEAYAMSIFSGRPELVFASERSGGGDTEGIVFTEGRTWQEQRGFTVRRLRELGGFGTRSMETILLEQAEELVRGIEDAVGEPISTFLLFYQTSLNSLWAIVAGHSFDLSDPVFAQVTKTFVAAFSSNSIFAKLPIFLPWFAKWFPAWLTGMNEVRKLYEPLHGLLEPYITKHFETHVPGQSRDLIDAFIDQIHDTDDRGSSFHRSRSRNSVACTVMDLFWAATESVSNTLSWLCLFLAKYPHIQNRLAKEVQLVIGSRFPSLADRRLMPFVESVLHETMRFRTIVPLGAFHSMMEPVHFHGFDIPKGTMIFANAWEAHNNQELWGDPENFRPDRWLSADGKEFQRRDAFLAFSTGKRVCPGEQMGRDELFLFTVRLFQKFSVEFDPNDAEPCLEPMLGGTAEGPKPHRLIFQFRH